MSSAMSQSCGTSVSETELDGKTTNIKIGVIQVLKKQDGGWKLLARAAYTLPQPA